MPRQPASPQVLDIEPMWLIYLDYLKPLQPWEQPTLDVARDALFSDIKRTRNMISNVDLVAQNHGAQFLKVIEQKALQCMNYKDGKTFLHDGYVLYFHPTDYKTFESNIDEWKKEAYIALKVIKETRNAHTLDPFNVSFEIDEFHAQEGSFRIEVYNREDLMVTVPGKSHKEPSDGLRYEAEAFDVPEEDWEYFHHAFMLLGAERCDLMFHLLKEKELYQYPLGQFLDALGNLIDGNFMVGLRTFNSCQALANNEHATYLRILCYLAISDVASARRLIAPVFRKGLNPMGSMILGLTYLADGDKTAAYQCMLRASKEPALNKMRSLYFPIINELASSEGYPVRVILLKKVDGNDAHLIVLDPKLSFYQPTGSSPAKQWPSLIELAPAPEGQGDVQIHRLDDALCLKGDVQVSGEPVGEESRVLNSGETVLIARTLLRYQKAMAPKTWVKNTDRNFARPCHILSQEAGKIHWYFPADEVVTIGRGKERGNDIELVEDLKVTTQGHAEILWNANGVFIVDLNSTNGTSKNNIQLKPHEKAPMLSGDQIRFGDYAFIVNLLVFDSST